MMLPGLISLAFYKRRPTWGQVTVGLVASVGIGALIGYPFPGNPIQGGPVIAGASAGILYLAVVAYFYYRYNPNRVKAPETSPPIASP
jgi:drug/metabolite transporter (DMT)-like permease